MPPKTATLAQPRLASWAVALSFFTPKPLPMSAISIPIPSKVHDEVAKLLQAVIALLAPYQMTLTDTEQKSLSSVNMGAASVAFASDAGTLLTQHVEVLRRSISDEVIAGYPALLDTFGMASSLADFTATVSSQLGGIGLVAGSSVMETARAAYQDGQNDKGKHPGVAALIGKMSQRFAHAPSVVPPVPA
jgi:hypothetical protein